MSSWFLGRGGILSQSLTSAADGEPAAADVEAARHHQSVRDSHHLVKLDFDEGLSSSESCESSNRLDLEAEDPGPRRTVGGEHARVDADVTGGERRMESAERGENE